MTLAAGTKLGPYDVEALLGAGGMGEVYRARDTKLNRDVAIKVLPDLFAQDPERRARFEREAHLLASLNHPNIAHVYGLEESAGVLALAMELVEGPTLADRIAQGPIALDEARGIVHQVAEALEAAHERGVVHRDLKPANVKLRPDGVVKVLDFGLAKALDPVGATPGGSYAASSPTMTMRATQLGMILGTAAYMAPEQAMGKTVDKRADIWAFGVVLFEMVTGKRPFDGEEIPAILAAVIKDEPDLTRAPAELRPLLQRCLEKDPKKRLRDIGDYRLLLDGSTSVPVPRVPARRRWVAWSVSSAAALLIVFMLPLSVRHLGEQPPVAEKVRFQILAPDKNNFNNLNTALQVSPNGHHVAFTAIGADGRSRLWIRSLDSLEARPLADLVATNPAMFWSPDSRALAFWNSGKLRKVEISGGPSEGLCDVSQIVGGAWSKDGIIIVGSPNGLLRVSASGGVPSALTVLDPSRQESAHGVPTFLPDGRHFVYMRRSAAAEDHAMYVGSLDTEPAKQPLKRLVAVPAGAQYAASPTGGHLLFLRENTLMAQPFDAGTLELTGEAASIADPVSYNGAFAHFSVSETGVLIYRSGGSATRQLIWFDRQGKVLGPAEEPGDYHEMALSPDGTRLATTRLDLQPQPDIWLIEFARRVSTQFTFDAAQDRSPVWSPDGSRIVFASTRDGAGNFYTKVSNLAATEQPLFKSAEEKTPNDWSPDGRFLLFTNISPKTDRDLSVLSLTGESKATPYLQEPGSQAQGQFSPDGRFVVYYSGESGTNEIYVRSFPDPAGKQLVSKGGGVEPRWRNSEELFYRSGRRLMSVKVTTTPSFQAEAPRVLFEAGLVSAGGAERNPTYDVTADGKRFLLTTFSDDGAASPINVVMNWMATLPTKATKK